MKKKEDEKKPSETPEKEAAPQAQAAKWRGLDECERLGRLD